MATTNTAKATTNTNTNNTAANTAPVPTTYLGKYAKLIAKLAGGNPQQLTAFKAGALHLYPQHAPKGAGSVMGVLYALVAANPGITGAALAALALTVNWHAYGVQAKSLHVAGNSGPTTAPWVQGYINGMMRAAHGHAKAGNAPAAPLVPTMPSHVQVLAAV